jgi:uncharacterized protein (DUF4415 family)
MKREPNPEMIDDENPEWTAETTARALTLEYLPPTLQAKLKGGRPRAADPKTVVTLRLRASVLAAYEAQGPYWRARMERMLDDALGVTDARREI